MQEDILVFVSAGRSFAGRFFVEDETPAMRRPGVMVLHGGAGVGAHEHERARMLAKLGYVAFVPDLFGEVFESREHGVRVIGRLVDNPAILRTLLTDALACMRGWPNVDPTRTAAIGFCFGGLAALELARGGADLRAAVSFHGGLTTRIPAEVGKVKASILVCTGAADPYATPEQRRALENEMTEAGADWQMHVYARRCTASPSAHLNGPGASTTRRRIADRGPRWAHFSRNCLAEPFCLGFRPPWHYGLPRLDLAGGLSRRIPEGVAAGHPARRWMLVAVTSTKRSVRFGSAVKRERSQRGRDARPALGAGPTLLERARSPRRPHSHGPYDRKEAHASMMPSTCRILLSPCAFPLRSSLPS